MDPYEEIRVLRARKDWTQTQLAEAVGVKTHTIVRWEQPGGLLHVGPRSLLQLSEVMGVDVGVLVRSIVEYHNQRKET